MVKGFEQEKQALSDEILRPRWYGMQDREGRFEGNHHPGASCLDFRDPAFADVGPAGLIANRVTAQDQETPGRGEMRPRSI